MNFTNFEIPVFCWRFDIWKWRFGFQHDIVEVDGVKYLERWILWLGITLRVHKFYKGDQDRALHDHPWWFITFPLQNYYEVRWDENQQRRRTVPVRRLRFHYRPATHRHAVHLFKTPTWTLVMSGWKEREWGFWRDDREFIHWRDWVE